MKHEDGVVSETALPAERRGDGRTMSVYRPVLIETDEFSGFCLVKNLSPGGMMGVAFALFAVEQPVTVQFHPEHVVSGQIVWSRDQMIGVRFHERIDAAAVLQNLASKRVGTLINRAPRLPIESCGQVEVAGRSLPIAVLDISQRGIKVAAPYLKPPEEVVVRLDGMEPRRAQVRWVQDGMAGLHFVSPIDFEELARWVIERQSR